MFVNLVDAAETLGGFDVLVNEVDAALTPPTYRVLRERILASEDNKRVRAEERGAANQVAAVAETKGGRGHATSRGRGRGRAGGRACYKWSDTGKCSFGDGCRFVHDGPSAEERKVNGHEQDMQFCKKCVVKHLPPLHEKSPDNKGMFAYSSSSLSFPFDLVQMVCAAGVAAEIRGGGDWVCDSGCTCHMCCDVLQFAELYPCPRVTIHVATGETCFANQMSGHGTRGETGDAHECAVRAGVHALPFLNQGSGQRRGDDNVSKGERTGV